MTTLIRANGISINYRLEGPENASVVMLSNSLMSNYTMWDDQMAMLTESFRVLRYDQRGHGGTEAPAGPYTIELLTEDVRALLDALEIDAVHFVGLSMGGFTAQMLALEYPERVLSLSLCDTACAMPPKSLWDERIRIGRTDGMAALMTATLERWFTASFRQTGDPRLAKVREMILGTPLAGYVGCAEAIRDMDICERIGSITKLTLVLVGEDDPACPLSSAQVLHERIGGSRLVIIPAAAHLPNIEQTEAFNRELRLFLRQVT
ncbi:3-oxoadipate enol-lactonase [Desulfofustis limnaeus]|jgi:3-oxoadipate enol-lactonase|uniref:3-oxoadipate enol-lactonase n=1 Tax=Desulfofustis limnaeus TaxID=2740163 RepID=A0ABM7W6L9_9BACT|nr:3-oxoadipate enol-lactonase [Desulfofustis limnaeus]MDX9895929.1 3-oxoadipate enol-lactonase [Desulfofustis sp.]BDD86544.1 3-oxoadipate enol-lactonase [Desulfofustis limnaeus]